MHGLSILSWIIFTLGRLFGLAEVFGYCLLID